MLRRAEALLFVALALSLPASAHEAGVAPDFIPPPAGSYRLPVIQACPEGEVMDDRGRARSLSEFTRGRITVVGLVYTRCADADACPRATWAFSELRRLLRADPALQARVRLVTLSFDPVHDRPGVMAAFAARSRGSPRGAEWSFLTTRSPGALEPILVGFGQDLRIAADSQAVPGTEEFTHTLKVFLVDPAAQVREIYSTAYLVPPMIVNDIRTLDRERAYAASSATGTQLQKRLRSP
jgi:cytochrome oxidase Cu insertion factor (SCO1/SenC/PrrC family)